MLIKSDLRLTVHPGLGSIELLDHSHPGVSIAIAIVPRADDQQASIPKPAVLLDGSLSRHDPHITVQFAIPRKLVRLANRVIEDPGVIANSLQAGLDERKKLLVSIRPTTVHCTH